ncbi:hypothetical protein F511_14604 [Dorcoceras hygrometricum]|uniref:Uncharacterized protein n=1 Tax=Dorcoceras hygrometricum TaxID=472368 RepID=A0A2Z7CDH2_9LAMI|nr:hypothetical protein F511_14604 [Dorcoceras hygrometricum]
MSSWTKSFVSLGKLHETQKPLNYKTGLGFSVGESSSEGTSTQSDLADGKFKNMNFVKANVTHDTCLRTTQSDLADGKFKNMNFVKANVTHDTCESVKYDDQYTGQLNYKGEAGTGYTRSENNKLSWLKNSLDKDKAKAGYKSSVPNQRRRGSTKAKSVWAKPALDTPHKNAQADLTGNIEVIDLTIADPV